MGTPWHPRYAACVACGTTDRQHEALGRCRRCYKRHYFGYTATGPDAYPSGHQVPGHVQRAKDRYRARRLVAAARGWRIAQCLAEVA